jgi:hypothetical protein
MYSPFVMVLGNLISGVLFLLDEYTTSVHDYFFYPYRLFSYFLPSIRL